MVDTPARFTCVCRRAFAMVRRDGVRGLFLLATEANGLDGMGGKRYFPGSGRGAVQTVPGPALLHIFGSQE